MKKSIKLVTILFLSLLIIGGTPASATYYRPLVVDLVPSPTKAYPNEVVKWQVLIIGGATSGPNFDITFSDSDGYVDFEFNHKDYSISFERPYQKTGTIRATVVVTDKSGQKATASAEVQIKK